MYMIFSIISLLLAILYMYFEEPHIFGFWDIYIILVLIFLSLYFNATTLFLDETNKSEPHKS